MENISALFLRKWLGGSPVADLKAAEKWALLEKPRALAIVVTDSSE